MPLWFDLNRWWCIDPDVCRDAISDEEALLISFLIEENGSKWTEIAVQLPRIRYVFLVLRSARQLLTQTASTAHRIKLKTSGTAANAALINTKSSLVLVLTVPRSKNRLQRSSLYGAAWHGSTPLGFPVASVCGTIHSPDAIPIIKPFIHVDSILQVHERKDSLPYHNAQLQQGGLPATDAYHRELRPGSAVPWQHSAAPMAPPELLQLPHHMSTAAVPQTFDHRTMDHATGAPSLQAAVRAVGYIPREYMYQASGPTAAAPATSAYGFHPQGSPYGMPQNPAMQGYKIPAHLGPFMQAGGGGFVASPPAASFPGYGTYAGAMQQPARPNYFSWDQVAADRNLAPPVAYQPPIGAPTLPQQPSLMATFPAPAGPTVMYASTQRQRSQRIDVPTAAVAAPPANLLAAMQPSTHGLGVPALTTGQLTAAAKWSQPQIPQTFQPASGSAQQPGQPTTSALAAPTADTSDRPPSPSTTPAASSMPFAQLYAELAPPMRNRFSDDALSFAGAFPSLGLEYPFGRPAAQFSHLSTLSQSFPFFSSSSKSGDTNQNESV